MIYPDLEQGRKLRDFLITKGEEWEDASFEAMELGADDFAKYFQSNQLDGQDKSPGGIGLNIVTGNLFRSIHSRALSETGQVTAEVFNFGANYWWWHEIGTKHLRVRLDAEGSFKEDGLDFFELRLSKAIEAVFGGV